MGCVVGSRRHVRQPHMAAPGAASARAPGIPSAGRRGLGTLAHGHFLWCADAAATVHRWGADGMPMMRRWGADGAPMVRRWCADVAPIGRRCGADRAPMCGEPARGAVSGSPAGFPETTPRAGSPGGPEGPPGAAPLETRPQAPLQKVRSTLTKCWQRSSRAAAPAQPCRRCDRVPRATSEQREWARSLRPRAPADVPENTSKNPSITVRSYAG